MDPLVVFHDLRHLREILPWMESDEQLPTTGGLVISSETTEAWDDLTICASCATNVLSLVASAQRGLSLYQLLARRMSLGEGLLARTQGPFTLSNGLRPDRSAEYRWVEERTPRIDDTASGCGIAEVGPVVTAHHLSMSIDYGGVFALGALPRESAQPWLAENVQHVWKCSHRDRFEPSYSAVMNVFPSPSPAVCAVFGARCFGGVYVVCCGDLFRSFDARSLVGD